MKKYLSMALAAAMTVSLAACTPSAVNTTTPGSAAAPEYKDTLNIAITAQPPTLDGALTASQISLTIAGNIFDGRFSAVTRR